MRPTLTILRGLPASGKTTWARTFANGVSGFKRVSKDDLRAMLDAGAYSPSLEQFINKAYDQLIELALSAGYNVIADSTHVSRASVAPLQRLAQKCGADVNTVTFFDVPVAECIRRNAARANPVPESAILRLASPSTASVCHSTSDFSNHSTQGCRWP